MTNLLVDFLHEEPIVQNTKYDFSMFQFFDKTDKQKNFELNKIRTKNRIENLVEKFEFKTDNELMAILKNKDKYQKEAVEAAKIILKNRND